MVSLMVILFSTECFLFVYMHIDLLKLKAYKLFENSGAFLKKPACILYLIFVYSHKLLIPHISSIDKCFIGAFNGLIDRSTNNDNPFPKKKFITLPK